MSEGEIDAGHYYSKSFYKVLIFCDKTYTEKANNRTGGVGDETVIISSEVYGKVTQEKFIPIITERDEDGKEYVPAYIKTRIYVYNNIRYKNTNKSSAKQINLLGRALPLPS